MPFLTQKMEAEAGIKGEERSRRKEEEEQEEQEQ